MRIGMIGIVPQGFSQLGDRLTRLVLPDVNDRLLVMRVGVVGIEVDRRPASVPLRPADPRARGGPRL